MCLLGYFRRVWFFVNCSPPGSSVHGILQAPVLKWVVMPSSRGSSWPMDQTCISYVSCIGRWVLYHSHHLGSPNNARSNLKINCLDFPGDPVPAYAGGKGSIAGPGRFHMPLGNKVRVPKLPRPWSWAWAPQQEKPPQWEAHMSQPRAAPTHHS